MSETPVLLDISAAAYAHQSEVDQVKRIMGIQHNYFDCWIYGFLENKNFNINETVAKLKRRGEFERSELSQAEITEWMMDNMRKGIIQVVGNDKAGRVTLYITTARDKPKSERRAESRKNFDMFVSYATRLRPESKRCQLAMLINQDGASMWSNLDMSFQADIALRIAKYYPGCVDKMYICKMGRTLATLAKPLFSRLPAIVSDRIIIISDSDIEKGKLLDLYDESVLPIALGGKNDCDNQENYNNFAVTIRDYFRQLKAAVVAGKSVKEWELENLRHAGYVRDMTKMEELRENMLQSSMSLSLDRANGNGAEEAKDLNDGMYSDLSGGEEGDLVTCDAVNESVFQTPGNHSIVVPRRNVSRRAGMTPVAAVYYDHMRQFENVESFFRINIGEMYDREWAAILKAEIAERTYLESHENEVRNNFFSSYLPPTGQLLLKAFVWLCLTVTSLYFFFGTLFIAILGSVTLTHIFFAMLAQPYNVFLYGCTLLVTAIQFTVFCSRGYDVARNTFNGKLVQALKAFGSRTLALQVSISIALTVGLFVVFCVFAVRYDILTGIEYSLAYGWIIAVCLTLIYHFAFAFGFKTITKRSYKHGSRVNNAETTLYIFLDVDLEESSSNSMHSRVEVAVIALIAVLTFAAGLSYILNAGFFFLCATVVLEMVLLPLCGVFFASNVSASYGIIMCAVFYVCIFWITATFTMRTYGWTDNWGNSLLASLFVMLFFCVSSFVSIYGPWKGAVRRWFFRVAWLLVLLHLIGCVVALLVFNYRMGLFTLALAVHLLIMCFRTNDAANSYGVFTVAVGFTFVLLTCCLMGHMEHSELYSGPAGFSSWPSTTTSASQTHLSPSAAAAASGYQIGNDFTPVCLMRFPSAGGNLTLADMARFAKMGFNLDSTSQMSDLKQQYPSFTRVGEVGVSTLFREQTESLNLTIATLRPSVSVHASIECISLTVSAYAISFFSFLMPPEYLATILPYVSFASKMAPLRWKSDVQKQMTSVETYLKRNTYLGENIYVVGHGPSGLTIAREFDKLDLSDVEVKAVLFAAPVWYQDQISQENLAKSTVMTTSVRSVYDSGFIRSAFRQVLPCDHGGKYCDKLDTTIQDLYNLCLSDL